MNLRRVLPPAVFLLLMSSAALAQGPGPGPGPGPVPSPWLVSGNTISYPGAVLNPASVTGGSKGPGTYNVSGGYYVNGVLVSGMPPTVSGGLLCNLTGGTAVPTSCSWNAFASLAIGTAANSMPFYSGSVWTTVTTGRSVLNPGTGALEALLPIQTTTGTSKTFLAADLYYETRRSNSGSAMTDTFPAASALGLILGTRITYNNTDATATATITAGSGTTMSGGGPTDTVGPGRSIAYVYDAPSTQWRRTLNTGTALLGPNNLSDLSSIPTARGNLIPSGTITNAQLVNSATTVNGQSCALGGSCIITAVAASVTVGTTTVNNGPGILYNSSSGGVLLAGAVVNNGVLGTNGSGVPAVSTTLPSGIAATNMALTTPSLGVATGTSLALNGASIGSNALAVTGSVAATAGFNLTQNGNVSTINTASNTSTGASALAGYVATNSVGSGTFGVASTGYITQASLANKVFIYSSTGLGGVELYADGANPIDFYVNGSRAGGYTSAGVLTLGTPLAGGSGGTGVNNGASTITVAGNLSTAAALTHAGAFATTITVTAITNSTLPAGTHTLAGLDVAQTWSALQGFNDNDLGINGSSSGNLLLRAAATAGSSVIRFPAGSIDFSTTGGAGQYVKQTSSGGALTVAAIVAGDLPLATNAAIGGMRGDTSTINCVAGVCSAVGGVASSIDAGGTVTSITNSTSGKILYNLSGFVASLGVGTGLAISGGNLNVSGLSTKTNFVFGSGSATAFPSGTNTSYGGFGAACASGGEALCQIPVSTSGTVKNLFVVAGGTVNSWVVTARKNLGTTTLTCTASVTTCNDTTHSFTVSAGDTLDIQVVGNAGTASQFGSFSVEIDTTSP